MAFFLSNVIFLFLAFSCSNKAKGKKKCVQVTHGIQVTSTENKGYVGQESFLFVLFFLPRNVLFDQNILKILPKRPGQGKKKGYDGLPEHSDL